MTEVAQVAAVVAHDMDDVTNKDEHNMSDAENKEDEVNEDNAATEKSEGMSHTEDEKPCHAKDDASTETDKTHVNGVDHKKSKHKKHEGSEAINGVAQDAETEQDAKPDTNEDQNVSDLTLKKEVSEEFKTMTDGGCSPSQKSLTPAAQMILSPLSLLNHRNSSDPESRWPGATFRS